MIAGEYVPDDELRHLVADLRDAGERVRGRLAEIDDAQGTQASDELGD